MFTHEMTTYLMILIFVIGYFLITIEHYTKINKATIALLMANACWVVQFKDVSSTINESYSSFCEHIASISQVIFFLIGGLAVVETINVHRGFRIISDLITVKSKKKLLWTVGIVSFFLSAVLDNLTTTIVMVSLLQKLVDESEDRLIIGGGIVIAANAGGAWTPIGDVTTTMLWIGGQISTLQIMSDLFLASVASCAAALFCLSFLLKGSFKMESPREVERHEPFSNLIFALGICALLFVPIFKLLTGLPPFMGMLLALGILWLVTDLLHNKYNERAYLRIPHVLSRIDIAGVLFFLGILLCIDSMESAGILKQLATFFDQTINNLPIIAIIIGIASAIVDNVPLVAATMSMYDLAELPQNHIFWQLTAYAAGTGGSLLIIGSAAGVVFMGLERANFFWYLRRISLSALVGYFAGIGIYFLQKSL